MESAKYVIVGSGAAGTTAAFTIRQHDHDGQIVLLGEEPHNLYSRLSLPLIAAGKAEAEHIELRHKSIYANHDIRLLTNTTVASLDIEDSVITTADGQKLQYEKLLIATGSRPRQWLVPGADLPGVMNMRTLDQAQQLAKVLPKTKHAIVVGGGFMALEYIQLLARQGITTTVVIRDPYYWANLWDEESGHALIDLFIHLPHIRILFSTQVELVEGDGKVEHVILSNGQRLATDLILLAIGTDPVVDWLDQCGLSVEGGIVTNNHLQTDSAAIWAAGDVTMFDDYLLGVTHRLGNWDNAVAQGQTAGANMAGQDITFDSLTAYSTSVFGTNITFLGDIHQHTHMTVVPRGSGRSKAYGRLIVHEDRLVGATLIHRFAERAPLEQIIRSRKNLTKRDILDLTDESVPLRLVADRLSN